MTTESESAFITNDEFIAKYKTDISYRIKAENIKCKILRCNP